MDEVSLLSEQMFLHARPCLKSKGRSSWWEGMEVINLLGALIPSKKDYFVIQIAYNSF